VVDRLITEARIPTEPAARRDVCGELWKQVQPDLPIIYLWTFKKAAIMKRNITGFTLVPDGLIRFTGVKYSQ
jgi:ABC-type transport system substrate-binding protein